MMNLTVAIGKFLRTPDKQQITMIEIVNLQKIIDQKNVLDIDRFILNEGEIAAIVGTPQSGQNPLFDILLGRSFPSTGEVLINNVHPYSDKHQLSYDVGVLFKDDCLYTRQSIEANLKFFAKVRGLKPPIVEQTLSKIGLADHKQEIVQNLSDSLSRRVAFSISWMHQPKVLLLFEPFSRCDETSIKLITHIISDLASTGIAVLIFTDDIQYVGDICNAIYRIENGNLTEYELFRDKYTQPLPFKIPVRLESRVRLFAPSEILYADAKEGKAHIYTNEGNFPTQFTLSELENRLAHSGFFRAHRSFLVNLQHVNEVIPYTRNSYSLKLDDKKQTEIPLSKTAAAELKTLLDY
jgi:ABC-2 type transport system ATP-binding protein